MLREAPAGPVALPEAAAGTAATGTAARSLSATLHPFLLYLGCSVLLFARTWARPTRAWIGDPGDPPMFMWHLRWVPYAILNGVDPFHTHHINAPDGVNLMWSSGIQLAGVVLSPITLVLGPVFSYNTLITVSVALSGWCAYLFISRLVPDHGAALVGGAIYAFSPYMVAQGHAHPNLIMAFIPPLMALLLADVLVFQQRPVLTTGGMLGGLAAAQLLLNEELLATEMLAAILAVGVLCGLFPKAVARRVAHASRALGVASVVSLTLSAWPLAVQFFGQGRVRHGTLWSPQFMTSDALSFVVPTSRQAISGPWTSEVLKSFTSACCPAEHNSYLGLPLLLLLLVIAVRLWGVPLVRFATITIAGLMVLSLGPELHVAGVNTKIGLPFSWVADLPVFGNIGAVRLMLYGFLFVGLLVAVLINWIVTTQDAPGRARALLCVGLALLPIVPRLSFASTATIVPRFFESAVRREIPAGSNVLIAPFARDARTAEPMLWQAVAGMRFRMVGGYAMGPDKQGRFSFLPIPTPLSMAMRDIQSGNAPVSDTSQQAGLRNELQTNKVDFVLVGPMQNRLAMVDFFRDLLDDEGHEVEGVRIWRARRP